MAHKNNSKTNNTQNSIKDGADVKNTDHVYSNDATADVLYQKLGDRWFAFSLIDDEVFFGSIAPEEIATAETRLAK